MCDQRMRPYISHSSCIESKRDLYESKLRLNQYGTTIISGVN